MYRELIELLCAFNANKVEYLIVGGYAVSFHAQPRATKDLDLLIRRTADNSKAVYDVLAAFGVAPSQLVPERTGDPKRFHRFDMRLPLLDGPHS
jgi:hypothetical protein